MSKSGGKRTASHSGSRQRKSDNLSGVLTNAMNAVSEAKVAVAQIQNMAQIDPAPPNPSSRSGLGKSSMIGPDGRINIPGMSIRQSAVTINNSARIKNGTFINIVGCQNVQIGDHNKMYTYKSCHHGQCESSSDSEQGETEAADEDWRLRGLPDNDTAELLRDSHRQVSDAELQRVSRHIGGGWRRLIRLLGIEDTEVDYIFHTHQSDGLEEVVYQLLKKWKQENPNPTVGELIRALERANMTRLLRHLKP